MFPRGKTEVACEVAPRGEAVDVSDEGDKRSCSEKADSRDGHEPRGNRVLSGERVELTLDVADTLLEGDDLLAGSDEGGYERLGDSVLFTK